MFLSQLTSDEKEAFISLAVNAARANGEIADEEHAIIEDYCREMGISFFDSENAKSVNDIIFIFQNSPVRHKKIVVFELLGLLVVDGDYDKKEKNFVKKFAAQIGISDDDLDKQAELIRKYMALVREISDELN